ncbi:MAG TPA: hypothetical protein VFJ86_07430 [Usitatibacter sp.]|jgi:hypothetical protein|nr:hypothetical protein [Usitatibacter sp.]
MDACTRLDMARRAEGPAGLAAHLATLQALRGPGRPFPPRLREVKAWQARRLAATYADLMREPRYAAATRFFLEDLYGPKDFSARDAELMRIVPTMQRVLPASAVETAALAIELEALTEALDHALAGALAPGSLDEARYAAAYRASSTREERLRQVELVEAVARRLDGLVGKPFIGATLRLMRAPAQLAGLGDLQDFLERGFAAFRAMHGCEAFLGVLRERETAIVNRLFSDASRPSAA